MDWVPLVLYHAGVKPSSNFTAYPDSCLCIAIDFFQQSDQLVIYTVRFQDSPCYALIDTIESFLKVYKTIVDLFVLSSAFSAISLNVSICCTVLLSFSNPACSSAKMFFPQSGF